MTVKTLAATFGILLLGAAAAFAQQAPPTPQQGLTRQFTSVNAKLVEMAKDFPEAKFTYRPGKDIRSFGEVLLHIMQGNMWAAGVVRDPATKWGDDDYKTYKTKAEIVAAFEKAANDANAAIKAQSDFSKTLNPWLAVLEHNAEHYGQLVQYYRSNGLVPPESRPKPKK